MLKTAVNIASAIFGLLGTWLMSRRYAPEFVRSIFYSLIAPILIVTGNRERVRAFMKSKTEGNRDLPDSVDEMALGLNLLFWAFFLQLVGLVLEARGPQH